MNSKLTELLAVFEEFSKPAAFFLLLIVGIAFRITDQINGAQFVDLMKSVAVSFFSVTGIQNFVSMMKEHLATKLELDKNNK